VQLPRQLKTLDDLLAQAEHYANHSMRNIGRVPLTLFLIGADGPVLFIPENNFCRPKCRTMGCGKLPRPCSSSKASNWRNPATLRACRAADTESALKGS
jgi:hypothetical protein